MCDPVSLTIASFAVGAVQQVASFQVASAQADAQNARHEENRREANRAAVTRFAHQQNQLLQEQAAASQEKENVQAEGLAARSRARTAAGEAGVSGLSVEALVGDFYRQQGQFEQTLDRNFAQRADFLRAEMDATESQTAARINSVPTAQRPSFAGAAIRILGAGVNSFSQFQQQKQFS